MKARKTIFGQKGKWNWEDAVRLCVTHPLHASFFVGKLWSYFVPSPPEEATLASLQGLYIELWLQHPSRPRGDPPAPRFPRRPRAGHPAGRLQRGPAARHRPADRHDRMGMAVLRRRPAAVLSAQRVRLGLHALARHLDRESALGNRELRRPPRAMPIRGPKKASRATAKPRPRGSPQNALAYWGNPALSGEAGNASLRSRAHASKVSQPRVAAEPLPRAAPERAAHADRDLSRPAGELTIVRAAPATTSPARSCCERGSHRQDAACPRSSTACRCRPAPG